MLTSDPETYENAFVAERLRRYVQVVVNFVGVGSSPTECMILFCGDVRESLSLYQKSCWRYRDSSPGQADHNRLC